MTKAGVSGNVGYVSALEAYEMLKTDKSALLVDVRTKAEWSYVGGPDLSNLGREPIFLEWQEYPSMRVNPEFVGKLKGLIAERGGGEGSNVLFLCRSGVRSLQAASAMAAAGYARCYNIEDGFEGRHDGHRRRGAAEGWKVSGLPWTQP